LRGQYRHTQVGWVIIVSLLVAAAVVVPALVGLFYGEAYSMRQITDISLEQRLPLILARTNGFALAGTLRGYFKVEGLGEAKLFVERAAPPYILIRTRDRFVIIDFQQPDRTRALYAELTEHWSGR
jgi:hypothetical protein